MDYMLLRIKTRIRRIVRLRGGGKFVGGANEAIRYGRNDVALNSLAAALLLSKSLAS